LSNLGVTLLRLFERTGDAGLLEEAVGAGRTAVADVPADDPDRARILLNLAIAIQYSFEHAGAVSLLAEAVDLSRAAVAAAPNDSFRRTAYLSGLSRMLRAQFEHTGDPEQLTEAVQAGRDAVAALPAEHPARAGYLSVLGLAVRELAERTGDIELLAEAVQLSRDAVAAMPVGHPDRAESLSVLELALRALFGSTGDIALLTEAVTAGREAIEATPEGHARRAGYLSNLGLTQYEVYRRTGDPDALADAIGLSRAAVAATPHDHPSRGRLLSNLGLVLSARAERSGEESYEAEANACYLEAAQSTTSTAATRIGAYRRVATRATNLGQHEQALAALEAAVGLAALLSPGDPDRRTQGYRLKLLAGLPAQAAAAAVSVGRPGHALDLLERARAVLADPVAASASALAGLRSVQPAQAYRLEELRDYLGGLGQASAKSAPDLSQRRRALYEEWDALIAEAQAIGGLGEFLRVPAGTDLAVLAQAGPVAFVYASAHRCDALILTPNPEAPVHFVPLPGLTEEEAESQARRLADALHIASGPVAAGVAAQKEIQGILIWLWEAIAEPILTAAGLTGAPAPGEPWPRIWWCPVGPLARFPLHAAGYPRNRASDDNIPEASARSVLDRVISSYIASTRHLANARDLQPTTGREQALIIAVADPAGAFPEMPGVAAEARALAQIIPGAHLLPHPTRDSALNALPGYKVMHFAGAGRTDSDVPADSSLILYDYLTAPLTMADIAALHLPGGMAYLSGLSSGAANADRPSASNEGIPIADGFAQAGYQHVISYLWDVSDAAASGLATNFYQALTRDGTQPPELPIAAAALHQAIRQLRSRYPETPTLWAAIIHTGP
jgi:tetratricopeptide (TPR) repeat protein